MIQGRTVAQFVMCQIHLLFEPHWCHSCTDPERGQGVQIPLKNNKNIGFLSNSGLDSLKN